MEYERIHKVQTGMISPSKLRIKLMGSHHPRKIDGSNSNSSRTSPSKPEDSDFVKNSLLATANGDKEVTSPCLEVPSMKLSGTPASDSRQTEQTCNQQKELLSKENGDTAYVRLQQSSKGNSSSSSTVHPVRIMEDDNLDYDSNASSSSFEFDKGERSGHNPISRSILRPMPSKWNDAEKWIINRRSGQANYPKRNALQNQMNRMPVTNMMRIAPEYINYDNKLFSRVADTKWIDFCQPALQIGYDKFSFVSAGSQTKALNELGDFTCSKSQADETTGNPAIRSVSMRDMGTEMTPGTSLEPSRTATPLGATTPLRSPTSSMPSTPRRGTSASIPIEPGNGEDNNKRELSEEELKLKTRREIVQLGVQLGRMNIAAWASKDKQEKKRFCPEAGEAAELEHIECEKRAVAWEETEKSKQMARYKREEINIQAWESQQKAKLEAEMRRIEAQVEQMRAQAHAKMVKKIALTRQRSEEKRAAAEARKNRDAERVAAEAEYIRQTGRMPSSRPTCCGWL